VAPRGTTVYERLAQASSAGRMSGISHLTIVINGMATSSLTRTYTLKGKGEGKKTAGKVVGGAGLGVLIGGIAGGGAELPSASSPVLPVERQSPLPRKASSCRSPANRYSSSGLSNPCLYQSQDSL
jgi:hypothetical protein